MGRNRLPTLTSSTAEPRKKGDARLYTKADTIERLGTIAGWRKPSGEEIVIYWGRNKARHDSKKPPYYVKLSSYHTKQFYDMFKNW